MSEPTYNLWHQDDHGARQVAVLSHTNLLDALAKARAAGERYFATGTVGESQNHVLYASFPEKDGGLDWQA